MCFSNEILCMEKELRYDKLGDLLYHSLHKKFGKNKNVHNWKWGLPTANKEKGKKEGRKY